jgi:SAM-dependent methyltransferase
VEFHCGDVSKLPFADDTFDLAISRNVTWLMSDPVATYAEWLRVLAPGGQLAVFDANWYRYLVDPELDLLRKQDQMHEVPEKSDARATPEEELRCERIAANLPLTSELRPAWDLEVLGDLGARHVAAYEDVWRHLWTPEERRYYRTSPLFLIVAEKG